MDLKFDWDPIKNESNFKKHGVDFEEAKTVFSDDDAVEFFDNEHSLDEDRFIIIGISIEKQRLTVCHCYRNGDDIIRIISARRANRAERELYRKGGLI